MPPGPPDGGWGWVVVGAAFTIQMLFGCVLRGFGVLYLRLLVRFSATASATSWVGTSMLISLGVTGPLGGYLMQRFSCRSVSMVGSIIMSAGIVGTGLVPTIHLTYLTFGATGIGLSLAYNASFVIVDKYFNRKKAFAFGASTLGTAVGMFVFPPVMDIVFRTYGFTGGLLLFGAITLQGCVASALFYPLRPRPGENLRNSSVIHKQQELETKIQLSQEQNAIQSASVVEEHNLITRSSSDTNNKDNLSVDLENNKCNAYSGNHSTGLTAGNGPKRVAMKMRRGLTACSDLFKNPFVPAMAFFTFAQFYAGYYTAAFAPALGMEKLAISIERASDSVTVFGATDAISKLIGTLTFDIRRVRHYRTYLFALSAFLSSTAAFVLPFINSYFMLLFMCGVFGFFHGIPGGQRSTILSDLVEPQMMPSALGFMLLMTSVGSVVSGISAGVFRDNIGTYSIGFYISALLLLLCMVIFFSLLAYLKPRKWKITS